MSLPGDVVLSLILGAALVVASVLAFARVRGSSSENHDPIVRAKAKARSGSIRPASISQRNVPFARGRPNGNGRAEAIATLTVKDSTSEEFALGRDPCILGSASDICTVVLAGEGIAPEHARIWYRQGKFLLHHVGGLSRKTYVSGHEADWVVLETGDEVSIGPHRLVFAEPVLTGNSIDLEPTVDQPEVGLTDDLDRMEAAVRELWAEAAPASETAVGQRSGTGKYKVHRRKDELAARVGGQWVKRGRTVVLER
jgi:hypothetical protein